MEDSPWAVLKAKPGSWVPWPAWYSEDRAGQEPDTWDGKFGRQLGPLYKECSPSRTWECVRAGRQGPGCLCPTHSRAFWQQQAGRLSLKYKGKHSRRSQSKNRAYVQVEAGAWDSNHFSFYVHTLICYAYHGPPPSGMKNPCAAHSCGNRLCLNPLHIRWESKSVDKAEDWAHRRSMRGRG